MPLINIYATDSYFTCSRSPRGERGLKLELVMNRLSVEGRSPRGERGLKPCRYAYMRDGRNVAPHVGSVWIETAIWRRTAQDSLHQEIICDNHSAQQAQKNHNRIRKSVISL